MAVKKKGIVVGGKDESLEDFLDNLTKDSRRHLEPPNFWLPTGCDILDWIIGGPEGQGFPGGTLIEVFGPHKGGKTGLVINAIKNCQALGGKVVYVPLEEGLTDSWVRAIGANPQGIYMSPAADAEEAFTVCEGTALKRRFAKEPTLLVVDSVASMGSADDDMESKLFKYSEGMASVARQMSRFFRRPFLRKIAGSKIVAIFINQIRSKIGVMFGNPETTPGGGALPFAASVRLRISKGDKIEHLGKRVGFYMNAFTAKTRFYQDELKVNFPFFHEGGIDNARALIYFLIGTGNLTKSPRDKHSVVVNGTTMKIGALRDKMLGNAKLYGQIREKARKAFIEHGTTIEAKSDD